MLNLRKAGRSASLIAVSALTAVLSAVVGQAVAQEDYSSYPERPITLIIPFSPGAGNDILGRQIAAELSEILGQPVVSENVAGAGGTLGVAAIANAEPDGYTIGMGSSSSMVINPALSSDLPYDSVEDLAPIVRLAETPYVLAVHPDQPFQTVNDLIQYAEENPGALNYGSAGVGTTNHLAAAIFASMAGIELQHVPYGGAGPAMTDVMGGQIEMTFAPILSGIPQVKAGTLRALGVSSAEPSPAAPDIPTIAEAANLPDYNVVNWYGLVAPAGTPAPIVDRLNEVVVSIITSDEMSTQLEGDGAKVIASSPADFGNTIAADLTMWRQAAELAGLVTD